MKKTFIMLAVVLVLFATGKSTVYADYYSGGTMLHYGMQSSEVGNLQSDLRGLGYFYYAPTGYFGSWTQKTVKIYQRDHGLAADGIVGHTTARKIKADKVIRLAKRYLGVPYVWGGASPSGFDCSGFTYYVLRHNGIAVPRSSQSQFNQGTWIPRNQLQPGDLVFFTTYKPGPSHVGIYLGGGKFIQASSGSDAITIARLDNVYFAPRYLGAKRVIW